MSRPLHAEAEAAVAFDDAIELLAATPHRLLRDAAAVSQEHGDRVVGELAVDLGGLEVGRDVVLEVGAFRPVAVLRSEVPLTWRAARGAALFPTADAVLAVTAGTLEPPRVRITLDGTYDPPWGAVGEALDRAGLGRVAEAVVQRFVGEVARRLEDAAAGSTLTSRI